MHEELYLMRQELHDFMRKSSALKSALWERNKLDMTKASLIMTNFSRESSDLQDIAKGAFPPSVSIKDYQFINNFFGVVRLADSCLQMGNLLDENILLAAYRKLTGNNLAYYRRSNSEIEFFKHVPEFSEDIEPKLKDALRRLYTKDTTEDVVHKAMYVHNKILDIYPFEEYSVELAIFAMNYVLLENGLMSIDMSIDKYVYRDILRDVLKNKGQEKFYDYLSDSIYRQMISTLMFSRTFRG